MPVSLGGPDPIHVVLLDGDEAADVAHNFSLAHDLPQSATSRVREALCSSWPGVVTCSRDRALLYHQPNGWEGLPEGLNVFEGEEPADAIYRLVASHGGPLETYRRIADLVCDEARAAALASEGQNGDRSSTVVPWPWLRCTRSRFVAQSLPVSANGNSALGVVEVLDDDEPVDAVFRFAHSRGLDAGVRRQVAPQDGYRRRL
jgi:hypothetical protein